MKLPYRTRSFLRLRQNKTMTSTPAWLPQWTPHSLAGNPFFYLHGDGSKAWLSANRQSQTRIFFPNSINVHLVEQIEDAQFVVIDDDFQPTDKTYQAILEQARQLRIPVLIGSAIEAANRVFLSSKETSKVSLNSQEIVNVDEDEDDDGYSRLTFDENTIKAIGVNKEATEYLHHQILLRDTIVRRFAEAKTSTNNRYNLEIVSFQHDELRVMVKDPPRIAGTRWKLDDVLSDYLAEAYTFVDRRTCIRQWDEAEFNKDYGTPYGEDEFKPADAVFTALYHFFCENKKAVEELLPSPRLHLAVEKGHVEDVRLFLKHGSDAKDYTTAPGRNGWARRGREVTR
ncbi:hypothetical protein BC936DRAFT_141177 [Jimgerdemannia flammicorona]|uniref:Uncharacterized protein n=1 Tax=Jimgerdemannia flammicorona TaxID=994334 RepID=A0A433DG83_9FUNG|nr:hypothetical protein BC936DRAFT_141177 [Jimgerdemannia flammicorona]